MAFAHGMQKYFSNNIESTMGITRTCNRGALDGGERQLHEAWKDKLTTRFPVSNLGYTMQETLGKRIFETQKGIAKLRVALAQWRREQDRQPLKQIKAEIKLLDWEACLHQRFSPPV